MENNEKNDDNSCLQPKAIIPSPLTKLLPKSGVYYLEQMKNGITISNISIVKNCLIFGRAHDCDVQMDHPSVSRYHAALLWAPKNDNDYENGTNTESFWYLIDCGSTHGTFCNKNHISAGKMIKITPNNNVFRFGASTRLFTLCSKNDDSYDDNDGSSNFLNSHEPKSKTNDNEDNSDACTWGMSLTDCNDDDEEETADSAALKSIIEAMKDGQSSLQSPNENAYSDNPYKCIQQWFEREGYDFDYKTESINNKFKCIIEIPIDGQWIPIESKLMNKKKESITNACFNCCKLLDQANLLFTWQRKDSAGEKARKEYYDDDDDVLDETIKSKTKKMKASEKVDNYESLNAKWKEINEELRKLKVRLATIGIEKDVTPEISANITDDNDTLDLFMNTLNQRKYGLSMNEKIEKSNLRMQIKQLEKEQSVIEKLILIAKPVEIVIKKNLPEPTSIMPQKPAKIFDENNQIDSKKESETEKTSVYNNDDSNNPVTSIEQPTTSSSSDASKKNYKEIRKIRQNSIIESIEREKQLEMQRQKQQEQEQAQNQLIENSDDFIDWVPFDTQTGDGRTHLNDKFGY